MFNFIICAAIAIWTTSTLFMLFFWLNALFTCFQHTGKIFTMPFGYFFYIHFCPIVHTIQCFKIMQRAIELQEEKRRV